MRTNGASRIIGRFWPGRRRCPLNQKPSIDRLLDDRSIRENDHGFPTWAGTRFENGKIIALHLDLGRLPLDHFVWVEGVDLSFLSLLTTSTRDGRGKFVKTLQLPFPDLCCVSCGCLGLCELDLSRVERLEELDCCRNHISELDLSSVPLLRVLNCSETHVSRRNLAHTPMLTHLDCDGTSIAELDLTGVPSLVYLDCCETKISKLELSKVRVLESLRCTYTAVSTLDLWCVPRLTHLDCRSCPMYALDLAAVPHLTTLWCSDTRLSELNLGAIPNLTSFDCDSKIDPDLSGVPSLQYLLWECWASETKQPALSAVPI